MSSSSSPSPMEAADDTSTESVYLKGFCREDDPLWDPNITWYTEDPEFTICFRKTVLILVPVVFFWLFLPLEIYKLFQSKSRGIPLRLLGVVKLLSVLVLVVIAFIDLIYWILNVNADVVDIFDPVIRALTFITIGALLFAERSRGLRISGIQWLFFCIYLIMSLVDIYSHVRELRIHHDEEDSHSKKQLDLPFITFVINVIFIFVSFLCHFFVEPEPLYKEASLTGGAVATDSKLSNPCPQASASFPSLMTFAWLDGLCWTGFKRELTSQDLWDLVPSMTSRVAVPIFNDKVEQALSGARIAKKQAMALNGNANETGNDTAVNFNKDNDNVEVKPISPKEKTPNTSHQISIFPILAKTYGLKILAGAIFKLLNDVLLFAAPLLLKYIIRFASSEDEEMWKGIFYAVLLFLCSTMTNVFLSKFFYEMYVIGIWIKSALTSAVYRKALKVSAAAKTETATGEIVNLMSVDVQKLVDLMPYINMVWSGPLQITIAVTFLWKTLGPSVLAGLFVMILLIPINGYIAMKNRALQVKQMKEKDERVKLMNEILQGIKILKLYAWENSFGKMVGGIRDKEIKILKTIGYLQAGTSFIWTCAPYLVSLVTFATYVLSSPENVLDSEKAFVSLALFNILRFPMSMLPMIIGSLIQASVSIRRISKFINSEELDPEAVKRVDNGGGDAAPPSSSSSISIEKATFRWEANSDKPTLTEISLEVKKGSLVAVVGTVGSGKSSLLSAILGEMEKVSGSVVVNGSIAYAAQQAWIQNATLKNNILFGKPWDEAKYKKIIKASALEPDLEVLPAGDETEIGEKGINLSGGQKQRVSLARAMYSGSDVYLLDDPLSAVDAHVGKHIYDSVLANTNEAFLSSKTRLLVTHGVTFLRYVDQIVVMKDGRISEIGTYKELLEQRGAFSEFLVQFLSEADETEVDDDIKKKLEETIGKTELEKKLTLARERSLSASSKESLKSPSRSSRDGNSPTKRRQNSSSSEAESPTKKRKPPATQAQTQQYAEEKSETGKVEWIVYKYYVESMGFLLVLICLLSYVFYQALNTASTVWLSQWSDAVNEAEKRYENASNVTTTDNNNNELLEVQKYYLGIYGALGIGQAIAAVFGALFLYLSTLTGANHLHRQMLYNVLRSPMSFFDTTPQGRILNRFGKDIDVLDSTMPMVLRGWITCFLAVVSSLLVIVYTTPIFIVPVSFIIVGYYIIQRIYVSMSRQLKRLESVSRSPIYSYFGETITGSATIRAYQLQQQFIRESERRVDENQKANYPSTVANRWLSIRLEMIGNLIVFSAALLAVLGRDVLSPGLVGLSVSYAITVTQTLNWLVRMASEVETNIVAVERLKEYSVSITEAPWDIEDTKPEPEWPQSGKIQIKDYSTRYREGLDLVLKNVNVDIEGGEKIGIVGRTGAGKSSLTLALFRMIEPVTGEIIVDGLNISKLGLHQLRSKLTIIPQDPVLFSGTLRMNLDPLEKYGDDELWAALSHSHLKDFVSSLSDGLDHQVSEGGENLSVGQRQLICLARALLRKTKLLILDEATAAIDLETDELIQATIREEFKDCTVITIAHRLNTIIDYSKILVLQGGEKVEYDSPKVLMENKNSLFYSMCKDAGLVK